MKKFLAALLAISVTVVLAGCNKPADEQLIDNITTAETFSEMAEASAENTEITSETMKTTADETAATSETSYEAVEITTEISSEASLVTEDTSAETPVNSVDDGFVIETDSDGIKFVSDYNGKGGKIIIPSEAEYIGVTAFQANKEITEVIIPSTCYREIREGAFADCLALKSVTVEGDMYYVGASAFARCYSLETVTFKGNLTKKVKHSPMPDQGGVWGGAFGDCYNLKAVEFEPYSTVGIIGASAFKNCFNLFEVKMPETLSEIHKDAFVNCLSLEQLSIPYMTDIASNPNIRIAGYMYGYPEESYEIQYVKADGVSSVTVTVWEYRLYYDSSDGFYTSEKQKMIQKPITLIVEKGSPAEAYAIENGIAYKYY